MTRGKKSIILVVITIFIFGYLYRFSPRRIEFLGHYTKVFAHRVNSLEKQKQALNYFDGIELDLVYVEDKNVLDVNHPPTKSIGLTFETYLSNIDANKFPFLWLDIKKLDTVNASQILIKLNALFESRNYPKNKILIETKFPEALPKFTTAGYKTSYYINPRIHLKTGENFKKEIANIYAILDLQPNIGLSSRYHDYNLLKTYFPDKTKYLWAITSPYRFKYNDIRTILEDENVAIVLTKFRSFSGNR